MKTFLQLVADDLYDKIGTELADTAVVFPNKRASLFFNEHLASKAGHPVWAPTYITISDLFRSLSSLQICDPIRQVCLLHRVYSQVTNKEESLDKFYFWGELLLNDFDDVDKNLVDTHRLFSNLSDLKAYAEDTSFLEKGQKEAIQEFFRGYTPDQQTELKKEFESIWQHLGEIYKEYKESLQELGQAYEGMLYRHALEQLDVDALPYEHYVFVGFNVLDRVEEELFDKLNHAGKAMFYWDYDQFYMQNDPKHEAGEFLAANLKKFPNQLGEDYFNSFNKPKKVRYLSAPTENAQARFLHQWIDSAKWNPKHEKDHAVVLCNEGLLLPVLHSIPQCVRNINVTMGFPLAQTPICSYLQALINLQTEGYDKGRRCFRFDQVLLVLKHTYTLQRSTEAQSLLNNLVRCNRFFPTLHELQKDDFLKLVFTPKETTRALCCYLQDIIQQITVLYQGEEQQNDFFGQLYRESLFKAFTTVGRLSSLIQNGDLNVSVGTLRRLLNRLLDATSIPFHGEPAIGLQIMGVLETRNLDFSHLLMLSVNEGQLPHGESNASFIPYNLRKAFGMTTVERKIAVYAYYFYRLLQRAEEVTLLYNTSTDGMNRGEMSRFMLQYLVDSPDPVERFYLEAQQSPQPRRMISIAKDTAMLGRMLSRFEAGEGNNHVLSPSALNTYLDCQLKFYYRYVAGLKVPDEVSAEIDNALFGTIYHLTAQRIYEELSQRSRQILKEDIERLLKDAPLLEQMVDNAFKEEFFKIGSDEKSEYNGTQLINRKVIYTYILQLLRNDLQYAPFYMEGMEKKVYETFTIDTELGEKKLLIGGTIDRIDFKGETMRIVDYKTGGNPTTVNGLENLFDSSDEKRSGYVFQTFLYAAIMCQKLRTEMRNLKVAPCLHFIFKAANDDYSPAIVVSKQEVQDFAEQFEQDFRMYLQVLLEEIFSKERNFEQTEFESKCKYCDFKRLCRR